MRMWKNDASKTKTDIFLNGIEKFEDENNQIETLWKSLFEHFKETDKEVDVDFLGGPNEIRERPQKTLKNVFWKDMVLFKHRHHLQKIKRQYFSMNHMGLVNDDGHTLCNTWRTTLTRFDVPVGNVAIMTGFQRHQLRRNKQGLLWCVISLKLVEKKLLKKTYLKTYPAPGINMLTYGMWKDTFYHRTNTIQYWKLKSLPKYHNMHHCYN